MKRMQDSLRGFGVTLIAVWLVLCIAAAVYSQLQHIPLAIVVAVVPAFLLESALYLAAGMSAPREQLVGLGSALPLVAAVTAVAPYLAYSVPTHTFRLVPFLVLFLLAGCASALYFLLGKNLLADVGLLAFMATIYLLRTFQWAYLDPWPKLQLNILGKLMWIHIGLLAVLGVRKLGGVNFGLWPKAHEWWIGFRTFLFFLPVGALGALWLHLLQPAPVPITARLLGLAALTFVGTLWVLAAMEETFFRGILQQVLGSRWKSPVAGLLVTSVIFGALHLPYRFFPNWKFALLAGVAGIFSGE